MKIAMVSLSLWVASVGAGLLAVGCAHRSETPVVSTQSSVGMDAAVAAVQNDQSKSPEEKVKEIDAIQRQYGGGPRPIHRKRSNDQ